MEKYLILLYYHYTTISDLDIFKTEHMTFCKDHHLLGRIYAASEGINGTLSGREKDVLAYMDMMRNDKRFEGIVFKIDEGQGHVFHKLIVRIKKELVNLSLEEDINPLRVTGKKVEPKAFYEGLNDPNTIVIDARNTYEYDLGHFKGAIRPDIETFRELPKWIDEHKALLEGKKILTYCTGGIRCEKFSGWLVKEGYEDVGQLDGGIVTYGKDQETQGALWHGSLYVFDERISVPVNQKEHIIVGRDYFTGEPCERYINCANPSCNKQILASEENEAKYLGGCCDACRRSLRNRYVMKHQLDAQEIEKRLSLI